MEFENLISLVKNDLYEKRKLGIWRKASLWQPIVLFDKIYYENPGSSIQLNKDRLNVFFNNDYNNETFLDVACNNAYIDFLIAKTKKIKHVSCLDQTSILKIVDYIIQQENIRNMNTISMSYESNEFENLPQYDNILCIDVIGSNIDEFNALLPKLIKLTKKRLYIQPSPNEEIHDFFLLLNNFGNFECLGKLPNDRMPCYLLITT